MAKFDPAFDYTIGSEGGYVNNPNDSGGPTNWGVTQRRYSQYLHRPVGIDEMKAMTKDQAKQFYYDTEWKPLDLDAIQDQGVAEAIFDMVINRGDGYQKTVQLMVGVPADGHFGPLTLNAINGKDPAWLINMIETQAERFYQRLAYNVPKDRVFLKGWLNRAHRLWTLIRKA